MKRRRVMIRMKRITNFGIVNAMAYSKESCFELMEGKMWEGKRTRDGRILSIFAIKSIP